MKNLLMMMVILSSASAFAYPARYGIKGKCYVVQANTKAFYADIIASPIGLSFTNCDEAQEDLEKQCSDAAKLAGSSSVSVYKDIQIVKKSSSSGQEYSHSSYGGGSFVLLGGYSGGGSSGGSSNAESTEIKYVDIDATEGRDCKVNKRYPQQKSTTIHGADIGT